MSKDHERKIDVFQQVVAYLMLDHGDWYQLDAVGIYLGRQGRVARWPRR